MINIQDKSFGSTCLIYNFAQHYRSGVFKKLDGLGCHFFFGDDILHIKKMDYLQLDNFQGELRNIKLFSVLYWQRGAVKLLFDKKYSEYILLGEYYCLSTWIFLILNKLVKKRVFLWTHGCYGNEGIIKRLVKNRFFGLADGLLLYGNYARDLLIKAGHSPTRLHVVNNSLDYEHQSEIRRNLDKLDIYQKRFNNDLPNIIFVGRLTTKKRLDMLLEMQSNLFHIGEGCNLIFIGDGEHESELRKRASELGYANHNWFYGACYEERKIAELIFNADICVSPGNVGLTAMHSLVYGTPVITHGNFVNQMPEFESIEQGKTGGFFVENDLDSLVSKVILWIKDNSDHREEIRKHCYLKIDNEYNPEFQINKLKAILNES